MAILTEDCIRPFQIESAGIRGRMVRMGPMVDEILQRHDYPEPVSRLLGQALALTSVLASALKFDGVFTLQTKGDGAVPMLVADYRSPGRMRGYAQFDDAAVDAAIEAAPDKEPSVPRLMGSGYIAFTVDQGSVEDRYQGIVALEGATLADCVHAYFRESEQLDSAIRVAIDQVVDARGERSWRAGAIMLQRLPEGDPGMMARGVEYERDEVSEEDWRRAVTLMATARDEELVSPNLTADDLLYRLYHEDGVRVFDTVPLEAGCRCSEARAERVLASLPPAELADLAVDGALIVTCEFCNATYTFALSQFADGENE